VNLCREFIENSFLVGGEMLNFVGEDYAWEWSQHSGMGRARETSQNIYEHYQEEERGKERRRVKENVVF